MLERLSTESYQHKNCVGEMQRIFPCLCMKLIEIHRISTMRVLSYTLISIHGILNTYLNYMSKT